MQPCELKIELAGFFRFEKFKTDTDGNEIEGTREVAADWFPNLILDQGLNFMASQENYLEWCQVGVGSTPPGNAQTALVSRIAGVTAVSGVTTTAAEAPYYVARTQTFRFSEGVAAGNLAEVGVGQTGTGTTLFSRSLIKDALGNPTTITVLSDESLDVIYELRYYAPPLDVTGSIVATGNIGGTYNYILRPALVTTANIISGWWLPSRQTATGGAALYRAFTGAIGAVTSSPGGTASDIALATSSAYTPGTFFLDRIVTATAAQANLTGGVRSILAKLGIGVYQIEFDPPIPKTSNDVVQLTLRLAWGRRP